MRNPWESVDRAASKSLKLRFMGIKTEKKKEEIPSAAQTPTESESTANKTEPEEMFGVVGRQ